MDTTEPARPDWWDSFLERVDALDPLRTPWEWTLEFEDQIPEEWRASGALDPVVWVLRLHLEPANAGQPLPGLERAMLAWAVFHEELVSRGPAPWRARFADAMWIRGRRREHAEMAVHAYLDACRLVAHESSSSSGPYVRRASVIARQTRHEDLTVRVNEVGLAVMRDDRASSMARVGVASVFASEGGELAREVAEVLESLLGAGEGREGPKDWDGLRGIAGFAIDAWKSAKEPEEARRVRARRARLYIEEARQMEALVPASTISRTLSRGVRALRDVGLRDEAEAAHRWLLEVQQRIPSEFARLEGKSINVTSASLAAIDLVRGLPFKQQIEALVANVQRETVVVYRERALRAAQQNPLQSLIPFTPIDQLGRVLRGASDSVERAMLEYAACSRGVRVVAQIDPARRQIAIESPNRLQMWMELLHDLPLVDEGRLLSLATGLAAGLSGDWIVSTSVLVPQLEHLIRRLAGQANEITSTLNADGTQREKLFSELLKNEKVGAILGEDWIFDLQSLLVDPGSNLRNRVAHGMVSDDGFHTTDSAYLWFLVLELVLKVGIVEAPASEELEDTASVG